MWTRSASLVASSDGQLSRAIRQAQAWGYGSSGGSLNHTGAAFRFTVRPGRGRPSRSFCRSMPVPRKVSAMPKSDDGVPALGRLPSGIVGLDEILRGGFLEGGVYIIQGSPGAGKTVLANEICFRHAASGGRAGYVTLLAEMHTRLLQHLRPMAFFDESVIPDSLD